MSSSLGRTHPFALVFSTCLPVSVCGTVSTYPILEVFLGRRFDRICRKTGIFRKCETCIKAVSRICQRNTSSASNAKPLRRSILFSPSLHRILRKGWNINRVSISCAFRHRLRTDLPLVDYHCQGNLRLSAARALTGLAVTCANILTSHRSIPDRSVNFTADENTLLPLQCKALEFSSSVFCLAPIICGARSLNE